MSEEKIGRIVKSVLGKSDSQLTDFLLRAVHKDYDKKRLKGIHFHFELQFNCIIMLN